MMETVTHTTTVVALYKMISEITGNPASEIKTTDAERMLYDSLKAYLSAVHGIKLEGEYPFEGG